MSNLSKKIFDFLPAIYKIFLFLISIFLIVQLFPRQVGFQYEFQQARPWMYDDLLAPFDFAILKTEDELNKEKQEVLDTFKYYYHKDIIIYEDILESVSKNIEDRAKTDYTNTIIKKEILKLAEEVLSNVFLEKGIIDLNDTIIDKESNYKIRIQKNQVIEIKELSDFLTLSEAYSYIKDTLNYANKEFKDINITKFLKPLLWDKLTPNVIYNESLNNLTIEEKLSNISTTKGMIQEGEIIVSKGELITADKYQILKSFKAEYNHQMADYSYNYIVYIGQLILVSISIIALALFLITFRKDIYADNRKIVLILVSILFMVLLTSIVVKHSIDLLYLVPVCIIPIVIRSFFDNRLALYVHIITIILIGFMVPKSFQFVFLQFIADIIAILSIVTLRRRSQIFFTAALIFLTYSAVFTGLSFAQTGTFWDIDYMNYGYFAGSAALTLFAYPIIFMLERIFGMPTDFSLLELSDTNNRLLRELSMKAPGTFQHSLQVANLTEEAIIEIGGNPLLARTGALYHDIGKTEHPMYFSENQSTGVNPHEEISYEESADIIIDHVIKGIEKARKYNLPEYIIDFIRTHHGTNTARYFYLMSIKDSSEDEVDKNKFTYPGPKPFSKETAVLMMADAVEASSKSLENPDEKSINDLVDSVINAQIEEKQFENANITFKDITNVKRILKQTLSNIFHIRIAYPS